MWPICTANNALWLLLPLLFGFLTGWWVWSRSSSRGELAYVPPVRAPLAAAPVKLAEVKPVAVQPAVTVPVAAPLASGLTGSVTGAIAATGAAAVAATVVAKSAAKPAAKTVAKPVAKKAEPKATVAAKPAAVKVAKPKAAAKPATAKPAAAKLTAIGIPAAVGKADDLLQIKGVGPKLNELLIGLGITRFDQISKWGTDETAKVDGHLGSFKGRIVRDKWVEQSGLLARGAIAEFESKFGKLDSENQ